MARRLVLITIVLFLVLVALLPVVAMFADSVFVDGRFSLSAYRAVMQSSHQWQLMRNSMSLAGLVTVFTVFLGCALGLLLGKTDLPGRRVFIGILVIPLLIPPYILAVSWSDFFGSGGLVSLLLGPVAARTATHLLFGLPGTTFILISIFLPIPMLLTLFLLRTINPRLEEAARLVTGWPGVLKGVTIPLIMPGILLGAVLVFLLSFGEFSVPNFLRFAVFPVESFTQFSAFYDFRAATAAASPLVVVTLILLSLEAVYLREKTYRLRPSPTIGSLGPIQLGAYRWAAFALVVFLTLIFVAIPLLALLMKAGGPGVYLAALKNSGGSLLRSFLYAVLGATALTIVGFFVGYLVQRKSLCCWRALDSMTLFIFALPGTVVGIGLIALWNKPETIFIYSTPVIIILGYVAKYTALTSRISMAHLGQIPISMEEAAQVSGSSWLNTIRRIVLPLASRGLMASWAVGYVFCMRDMGITTLVYPPGYETLPVRIFTQMANGNPALIAALCIIMIVAVLAPAGLLMLIFSRQNRKQGA